MYFRDEIVKATLNY